MHGASSRGDRNGGWGLGDLGPGPPGHRVKQREVIFRTRHWGHAIEVVRVTTVLGVPGRKMKVERHLRVYIDDLALKSEEAERPGLQQDLVALAQAIAEQLPTRSAPSALPDPTLPPTE